MSSFAHITQSRFCFHPFPAILQQWKNKRRSRRLSLINFARLQAFSVSPWGAKTKAGKFLVIQSSLRNAAVHSVSGAFKPFSWICFEMLAAECILTNNSTPSVDEFQNEFTLRCR